MRFFWRSPATPMSSYGDWIAQLDRKNRRPGTSAPTLAAAWAGPLDLLGALSSQAALRDLALQEVTIEARARFDAYAGNVRNHDLVLRGHAADGAPVVICVEAKAGEPLGATVGEQLERARKALDSNPRSKAAERVYGLIERFCEQGIEDKRIAALRYQLLTAWAGTMEDAAGAAHAVFVVHEFRTDDRPEDKSPMIAAELAAFAGTVLGCSLPSADAIPWCVEVPSVTEVAAQLYVAHVVTDLRSVAVTAQPDPREAGRAKRRATGFAEAFSPEPETWGLRGDPRLWDALRWKLDGAPVPLDETEAETVLHDAVREVIGCDLRIADHAIPVPAFITGSGMSDGQVDRDFWLNRALPLLAARAAELNSS